MSASSTTASPAADAIFRTTSTTPGPWTIPRSLPSRRSSGTSAPCARAIARIALEVFPAAFAPLRTLTPRLEHHVEVLDSADVVD